MENASSEMKESDCTGGEEALQGGLARLLGTPTEKKAWHQLFSYPEITLRTPRVLL
jgi:hypothetical protein